MRFMILILDDERVQAELSDAERERLVEGHRGLARELEREGKLVGGERLRPNAETTTLLLKNGEPVVRDGPFAETKEVLGGYYLVECASKEEALAWAKRSLLLDSTVVEVRPVWKLP